MAAPSAAAIMIDKFGTWGGVLMNLGVVISVLSSWLVWMLMLGEMPLVAARNGTFPKYFNSENKHKAPTQALLWTTIIIQAILIFSYFAGNAWNVLITITSVMALPCYLFSTLFLCKIIFQNKYPKKIFASKTSALITGLMATIYSLWLIYAAGVNYLMIACVAYAIGLPLYIVARKQGGEKHIFAKNLDKLVLVIIILLGIAGIVYSVLNWHTLIGG
jgi:arginine:ornithine antiporter/lysine permease